jgi:hypothetical protein
MDPELMRARHYKSLGQSRGLLRALEMTQPRLVKQRKGGSRFTLFRKSCHLPMSPMILRILWWVWYRFMKVHRGGDFVVCWLARLVWCIVDLIVHHSNVWFCISRVSISGSALGLARSCRQCLMRRSYSMRCERLVLAMAGSHTMYSTIRGRRW